MSLLPPGAEFHGQRVVLDAVLRWSRAIPEIRGAFLSGSGASGAMDRWSDLDLGFLCASDEARDALWSRRWDWDVLPWKHRFDADHIKQHFVIWWFEPGVQADMALYLRDELPQPEGAPYRVLWDETGTLEAWAAATALPAPGDPDWSNAWHEDERFWGWTAYCTRHIARDECYHIALEFFALRDILETWAARLAGMSALPGRHTERHVAAPELVRLATLFPRPDRASLRAALLDQIELYHELRARIDPLVVAAWRTRPATHEWVTQLVHEL